MAQANPVTQHDFLDFSKELKGAKMPQAEALYAKMHQAIEANPRWVNATANGTRWGPLHQLAHHGEHVHEVQYLIDKKADPNLVVTTNLGSWSPVDIARKRAEGGGKNGEVAAKMVSIMRGRRDPSPQIPPGKMPRVSSRFAVMEDCDQIRDMYIEQSPEQAKALLRSKIEKHKNDAMCVFSLLDEAALQQFLFSHDNRINGWILKECEEFVTKVMSRVDTGDTIPTPAILKTKSNGPFLRVPWVMDQSCREPATTTPFGHTVLTKYWTFKMMKAMGLVDIAIVGAFYGDQDTPENLFLEYLKHKSENLDGTWIMFGPLPENRRTGMRLAKEYGVPNIFLDTTLGGKDQLTNVKNEVLKAVREADELFTKQGLTENPWRSDAEIQAKKPSKGEIAINFVDIMERMFVENVPDAFTMRENVSQIIREWKTDQVFMKRVTAILIEEGRGLARASDYTRLVRWLQELFPEFQQFRIAVHVHAGRTLEHEASPLEAFANGAHGVWSSWIPHAAQGGCNTSFVFLDHLLDNGNQGILGAYNMRYGVEVAKHLFYMNFNSFVIPLDCPMWGQRNTAKVLTAFVDLENGGGDGWRARARDFYSSVGMTEEQKKLIGEGKRAEAGKNLDELQKRVSFPAKFDPDEDRMEYRIAGLVSDNRTWWRRMQELRLTTALDEAIVPKIRTIAYALMNANVRADFNSKEVLGTLVRAAKTIQLRSEPSSKRNH